MFLFGWARAIVLAERKVREVEGVNPCFCEDAKALRLRATCEAHLRQVRFHQVLFH